MSTCDTSILLLSSSIPYLSLNRSTISQRDSLRSKLNPNSRNNCMWNLPFYISIDDMCLSNSSISHKHNLVEMCMCLWFIVCLLSLLNLIHHILFHLLVLLVGILGWSSWIVLLLILILLSLTLTFWCLRNSLNPWNLLVLILLL